MRRFGVPLFLACTLALAACVSSPEKPEQQKAFAARLEQDYIAYERVTNIEERVQAVDRRKEFMAEWGAAPEFSGWVCNVHDVLTARLADGSANMLVLPLRCGGFGIANILESDGSPGAVPVGAILEGTPQYEAAMQLNMEESVIVSGRFMIGESGRIRENSVTEYGSMRNPEFLVIYTEIQPVR